MGAEIDLCGDGWTAEMKWKFCGHVMDGSKTERGGCVGVGMRCTRMGEDGCNFCLSSSNSN